MYKPNLNMRLKRPPGLLAVHQFLIKLFSESVVWQRSLDDSTSSYIGETLTSPDLKREKLKGIDGQMYSYLSWFALKSVSLRTLNMRIKVSQPSIVI